MSHILHLYHLSALDYLDLSNSGGASPTGDLVGATSPWSPHYVTTDMVGPISGTNATREALVGSYVQALDIRRKAHQLAAIIDGKHPCQNAQVPGGMTTKLTPQNLADMGILLNSIRQFIDTVYLPDVVTVANTFNASIWPTNWLAVGKGCRKMVSYGAFPLDDTPDDPTAANPNNLLLRGVTYWNSGTSSWAAMPIGWNPNLITEYTGYSRYDSGTNLNPKVGKTSPKYDALNAYSWLKSPRYNNEVCEVGPVARVIATAAVGGGGVNVSDGGYNAPLMGAFSGGAYNLLQLANQVRLALVPVPGLVAFLDALDSVLGRHACRAIECKYIADAMADWLWQINPNGGGLPLDSPAYTYVRIPASLKQGMGLTEAPRGALGHWMTSEFKKIVNYQCVVPSTWNFSPMDDLGQRGPVEQCLMGLGLSDPPTDVDYIKVLRIVHPFDCCIACAVHFVTPKKGLVGGFKIDSDGKVTKIPPDPDFKP